MKTVIIVYAIDHENGKQIIGIADSKKSAIHLVKNSGYGWDMTQHEMELLEILGYTTNRETNFKFENWEVHGSFS